MASEIGKSVEARLPSLSARADRKIIQKLAPNPSTGLLGPDCPLSPNEAMQKRPQKSSRRIVDLVEVTPASRRPRA